VDHQDWISIPVPALVDESLFEAAQEQLRENRTRAREGRRHPGCLLQGLTCCSSCGYAYYAKRLRQRGAGRQLIDYVYYRCTGTDGYRFSGGRVCTNRQLRGDLLEAAVWAEVRALLENPQRLEDEYRRRLAAPEIDPDLDTIKAQIAKVKQTISRLIDGYADGLIDKDEFTLRIRRTKERSARLEEQLRSPQSRPRNDVTCSCSSHAWRTSLLASKTVSSTLIGTRNGTSCGLSCAALILARTA